MDGSCGGSSCSEHVLGLSSSTGSPYYQAIRAVLLTSVSPAAACLAHCLSVEAAARAEVGPPPADAVSPDVTRLASCLVVEASARAEADVPASYGVAECLADYRRASAVEVPALDIDAGPLPLPFPLPTSAPTGVADARKRADWDGPDGWCASMTAEFDKVVGKHQALRIVPKSEFRNAVHLHGDRVSLAFLLVVFKCKADPAGVPLPGILGKKCRVAVSDPNAARAGVPPYAPRAAEATGNAVDTFVQGMGMSSVTLDAQAAYYHGVRPTVAEGGRLIFAPIPSYAHLFIKGCPGPDHPDFRKFVFRIDGNMPGLAEAGRIWHTHFTRWLVEVMGMTQSIVDPCIFSRVRDGGRDILIIRVHVDDGRVHYSVVASLRWFRDKFISSFGSSSELSEATENYTGLRFHVSGQNTTEVTCPAIMERLRDLVKDYPLPAGWWPLTRCPPTRRSSCARGRAQATPSLRPRFPRHSRSWASPGGGS